MASSKFDGIWKLMSKYNFEMAPDSVDEDLKCIICKRLMTDACQSSCSCHYCYQCIDKYLANGNKYCPGGKEECNEEYLDIHQHVHRNKTINNNIYRLKVKCPHKSCHSCKVLSEMENHLKECFVHQNQCPYVEIGCVENNSNTDSLLKHLHNEVLGHSRLVVECVQGLKDELQIKDKLIIDLKREMMGLKEDSVNMKNTLERLEKKTESRVSALKIKTDKRVGFTPSVERAQEKIEKLNMTKEKTNCDLTTKLAIGVLTYRIENFSKERESNVHINSPYFYSHVNGYKLRLRLYPGGYMNRKGFLAVHFIICKGENDDNLQWPCPYSIDISIINQDTEQSNCTQTFNVTTVADIGKEMFNKPTMKNNKPCGHNTFIAHKDLDEVLGLVHHDTVLIKCSLSPPL